MSNEFMRAMHELNSFRHRADANGEMRVSITFQKPSDRARFLIELSRSSLELNFTLEGLAATSGLHPSDCAEMTICGIKVRVL